MMTNSFSHTLFVLVLKTFYLLLAYNYVCIIVLDQNMVRAVLDQLIRANQMARRKGNASVALGTKAQIVASLILAVIVPE